MDYSRKEQYDGQQSHTRDRLDPNLSSDHNSNLIPTRNRLDPNTYDILVGKLGSGDSIHMHNSHNAPDKYMRLQEQSRRSSRQ